MDKGIIGRDLSVMDSISNCWLASIDRTHGWGGVGLDDLQQVAAKQKTKTRVRR